MRSPHWGRRVQLAKGGGRQEEVGMSGAADLPAREIASADVDHKSHLGCALKWLLTWPSGQRAALSIMLYPPAFRDRFPQGQIAHQALSCIWMLAAWVLPAIVLRYPFSLGRELFRKHVRRLARHVPANLGVEISRNPGRFRSPPPFAVTVKLLGFA